MNYLGQTVNSLNTRCIGHRSGILRGTGSKFVTHHFSKVHNPSDLRITPLRSVTTSDCDPNTFKKSLTSELRKVENDFILKLNTLYPYGLNDRLEKPFYIDSEKELLNGACVYKVFPKKPNARTHRGSKKSPSQARGCFDPLTTFNSILDSYLHNNMHHCRTILSRLKIKEVTLLGSFLSEKLTNTSGMER